MAEQPNRASVTPGTPQAREQIKSQLGFTLPPSLLPDELGERTTQLIKQYETQSGEFGEDSILHGQSAQQILESLEELQLREGKNEKRSALLAAFEEIAKEETKTPILQHIATGFEEGWDGLVDIVKGISTGARKSEQGILDSIFDPMLDLAGIRITKDGVHISQPKAIKIPDKLSYGIQNPRQQLLKQAIQGKGQQAWTSLPKERESLITVPGGPEPTKTVGQLAEGLTQAGMSWAIGDKAFNTAKVLKTAIPRFKSYFSTPAVQGVLNTATGEALTLQQRDRFAQALVDMGVDNEALKWIAGSPDEDAFTERFKSYLDGAFTFMGAGLVIEPMLNLGRAAFNMGWLGRAEKDPEKAAQLLEETESYVDRLLNTVPSVDEKTGKFVVSDPLVKIKNQQEPTLETGVEELKKLEKQLEDKVEAQSPVLDQEEVAQVTKPSEIVVPTAKEAQPVQAGDINPNEFFNIDPYKDVAFGDTTLKINFDRIDSINSVKELAQRMLIQIEQANPTSLSYGPKGKARKLKDGSYVTDGNVLTFEEIKKRAGHAEKQLRDMGYSPERFISGFKATTESLPHLMLMVRDLTVGKISWMDEKVKKWKEIKKEQGGSLTEKQNLQFVKDLTSTANVLAEMRGSQRDIARTQAAQRIDAIDSKKRMDHYEAVIKDVTGAFSTKGGERKLYKLIDHLDNLESVNEYSNVFKKNNITRIFDVINFMGINSYLSNLSTQTVNNVGSFAMMNLLAAEKYIGAASRYLPGVGGAGEITFDEANAHLFGIQQALYEGLFLKIDDDVFKRSAFGQSWEGFKELDTGLHQGHDIQHLAGAGSNERFYGLKVPEAFNAQEFEDAFNLEPNSFPQYLRTVINGTGTIMGLPGRMLMSGDGFFRAINYRSAIHALAMRRASEEGLKGRALQKRYTEIVKNLPEDIDSLAQTYAQVSLFQQNLDAGGVEKFFKAIEDIRKRPLMDADRSILKSLVMNPLSSFITSKIPFFRTPYNIFKQTLVERNPAAHLLRYVGGGIDQWGRWIGGYEQNPMNYRERFHSDEAFKQDVIAKSTTGGLLMYLGYSLGGGDYIFGDKARELLTPEGTSVEITGGSDPSYKGRDIASDQLRQQPEIFIRNLSTLDATSVPIGRADPIASLVMAGSIIGNYEAFHRNHIAPFQDSTDERDINNLQLALEEKNARLMFQIGNFFTDKTMLRGLQDVVRNTLAPNADPGKLIRDYVTKYAGQVPLANFFRGIVRATENQRYYPEGRIKQKFVPLESLDVKKSTTQFEIPDLTGEKVQQLEYIDILVAEWADEFRKVNIIDINPQTNDPIIRPGAVPMIDLEANPIGFNDREANIYERFLEQNLIPFSSKRVNETNTSVLISGLNIKFDHPNRWTHLVVGNEKIPLTSEQKLYWAAKFGVQNRNTFKQFGKTVKEIKMYGSSLSRLNPQKYLDKKVEILNLLRINKEVAKQDMIATYPELRLNQAESMMKNATETIIGE